MYSQQLSLFGDPSESLDPAHLLTLEVPPTIELAMQCGAMLWLSVSGGKDSQAMARAVTQLYDDRGWWGGLAIVFADLGRIEHVGTLKKVISIANAHQLPLTIVRRRQGDMLNRWNQRGHDQLKAGKIAPDSPESDLLRPAAPPFSSSSCRFCTAHNKVQPINSALVRPAAPPFSSASARFCTDSLKVKPIDSALIRPAAPPFSSAEARFCTKELKSAQCNKPMQSSELVVCAMGNRAEESEKRATEPVYSVRSGITTESLKETGTRNKSAAERQQYADAALEKWLSLPGQRGDRPRLALDWMPIHTWSLERVWRACGTSGLDMAQRQAAFRKGDYYQAFHNCPVAWPYVATMSRYSCSLCILGNNHDIGMGAALNPHNWAEVCHTEQRFGYGFRGADPRLWASSLYQTVMSLSDCQRWEITLVLRRYGLIAPYEQLQSAGV